MSDPTSEPSPQRERLIHVRIGELKPAPNAPKAQPAPPGLTESVRTYGVLQPLLARPGAEGYEVVAGFRRLQAAREAGLDEVPVRVYRVEDAALVGLYTASNVLGERRQRVSAPPPGEYRPTGKLSGLLEEELNRKPAEIPYKAVLGVGAAVLLALWLGLVLSRQFRNRDESVPEPAPTPEERFAPPTGGAAANPSSRNMVEFWRRTLADVDGVEVRDESGTPRLVFEEPVFSRLVTIDPDQKPRLVRLAEQIRQTVPEAVLMVIGHTDNDPIRPSSAYRSNEYLGQLRAEEVAGFLRENTGLADNRVRPISSGAEEPPFSNDNPADKARNRSVTLEIMVP